jgi:hypothetical protein
VEVKGGALQLGQWNEDGFSTTMIRPQHTCFCLLESTYSADLLMANSVIQLSQRRLTLLNVGVVPTPDT